MRLGRRLSVVLSLLAGCGASDTVADFTFTDRNPASPTFGQVRSLHNRGSDVVLLYFAAFD